MNVDKIKNQIINAESAERIGMIANAAAYESGHTITYPATVESLRADVVECAERNLLELAHILAVAAYEIEHDHS
jgi:hypothetical protein